MKRTLATIAILAGTLLLAACGNGDGKLSGGGGGPAPTPTTSSVALGSGSGASFQVGVLGIAVSDLSAGGSTTISANLQYEDGRPYTKSATIAFTSPCYQNNLATFDVNGQKGNTVTTSTGQANITYTAAGCSGTDTITATTTVNSQDLSATGVVNVAPAAVGSIQFVSANPSIISLKGSGGTETSAVVFKVVDVAGGPVAQAHVHFALDTSVGGIVLTPASATTGSDGQVQTVVQAGTQHTTVRVTASVTAGSGEEISTQSPGIVISTGLATEKHFSLSLESHNVEGYNLDGVTDKVTVILSDRFGNPVPDGTTVAFTTNGGQIQPSCTTENATGSCSVIWTSANPRPPTPASASGGLSVIGHAEILAYATGEESFIDVNGNGVLDNGDRFTPDSQDPTSVDNFFGYPPPQDDIGEIYLDQAQLGHYVNGDYFFDFNKNGHRDAPNGKFDGNGCKGSTNPPIECGSDTTGVGVQSCIVMSTSQVIIVGPDTLAPGQSGTYLVSDRNGNVPPAGMTFSISANGPSASVQQGGTVPDIGGCPKPPVAYPIVVSVSSTSQPGSFSIVAKAPTSNTLSYSNSVTVQ